MPSVEGAAGGSIETAVVSQSIRLSDEYSMVEAAAAIGWSQRRAMVLETLTGIRRAGADISLSYWATEVAGWLRA